MQTTALLDFIDDDNAAGFRLQRVEIYNWGTFDRHIWCIELNGHNALLTGDIGSGKSTLVDAITTLLVPHHRITYNKAAGAENRERTLYSYIRGEYKNEKDDLTQTAKAVALRDETSYTVLLSHFYNRGYEQLITLAQVFWLKPGQKNPERFFVIASLPLSIEKNFSNFGGEILQLKKRLQQQSHTEVFDKFKDYSMHFRRLFGIDNEQALELFYQTVSMKSVGNLTEFVRTHMLEKSDVQNRVEELRRNFDNLNRAHAAILKAKAQIKLLHPLIEDGKNQQKLAIGINELRDCREALPSYFAVQKMDLLTQDIEKLQKNIQHIEHKLTTITQEIKKYRYQEAELKTSIDDNGGRRLQALAQEIERLTVERNHKQQSANSYHALATRLALTSAYQEEQFHQNQQQAHALLETIEKSLQELQLQQVNVRMDIKAAEANQAQLQQELTALRDRQSNIPAKLLQLRQDMVSALAVDENQLPFVGELLQVAASERAWEGAIERLLHNFGLSLLVPEVLYTQISHYVDRTHLRGRLVYYRVKEPVKQLATPQADAESLIHKLRIKSNHKFYSWLEQELHSRFNFVCCDSLEQFHRLPQAITLNGQIKSSGQRHEKDDRYPIHDRSRYILGWDNRDKIQTLNENLRKIQQQGAQLVEQLTIVADQQQQQSAKRDACRDLLQIADFAQIDWQSVTQQLQVLLDEQQQLEQSSDKLKILQTQLISLQQTLTEKEEKKERWIREQSALQQQQTDRQQELQAAESLIKQLTEMQRQQLFPKLDLFKQQMLVDKKLNLQNLEKYHSEIRAEIQREIDNTEKKKQRLSERIVQQMQLYKHSYPAETVDVDGNVEAIEAFDKILIALEREDLPRHEARFKQLLNEGTINNIALFQNQLNKETEEIEEKIQIINRSLRDIEYSAGTYIELLLDRTQDPEIRDFQQDLRRCLHDTLSDIDFYDENKFLQVKAIIERFNGREGLVDLDRRWTQKVIDVRNWFNFSASERWREDNTEKELHSDSAGKSGGQKEKLAYTILASALAYQFGLEWGATQSRSFRFVVIDEAFGKGSDESTRYALELFKKLNLQLLIVTPLQKIHIIENYIRSVHYVHNHDGSHSLLRNLTIHEYREEKQRRQELELM